MIRRLWLLGTVFILTGMAAVEAQEETVSNALEMDFNQGVIAYRRGQSEQAYAHFEKLINIYNTRADLSSAQLATIATAARYLGATDPALYKDAVRVYDEAIAKDPDNIDARVALGDLLLEKYNNSEALDVFREALSLDPEHPGALLGLARSQHFDHAPEALETVKRSLSVKPDYVPARVFLAKLLIELEQYAEAEAEAQRALALDPTSLEALAVLAAVHYLSGDETAFAVVVEQLQTLNTRYAELYNTLAELAARNRFYADAVDFAAQAVALDELSWQGYGLLGMNQMRTGEIEAGRANLEKAFKGDPYNVWIKNTLDLTDTFGEYEIERKGRFILFIHRDEAALMSLYLHALADEAYRHYQERYGYQAKIPVRIEVYPRHADFSVRTMGIAGLGILGVSFGPVVAMDSPSARDRSAFNWGSTLWHELAHTFHLGMTDHRVPRWFSEGLAVYEERSAREGWGGDVTPDFLAAYRDGKLLPVSQLNNGFVRPSYPEQIVHSYYQASLIFELIERDWGFAAIRDMLGGFKKKLSTAAVIERALGMSEARFDRAFDDYFKERFAGPLRALAAMGKREQRPESPEALIALAEQSPDDFGLQMGAGQVLLEQEKIEQAEIFLTRARDLFPEYAGDDSPYWNLAKLYESRGDTEQAAAQLARMVAVNGDHYAAHLKLAELRLKLDDHRGAADALERALYIYPFEIPLHQRLAEYYGEFDEWPKAVRERQAVVALTPVDMAEARYQLARAYFENADVRQARREVLRALETAPNFDKALDLLLEIRAQAGKAD